MKRALLLGVLMAGCEGSISTPPAPIVDALPKGSLVKTCQARGQGGAAKMRLLWRDAYRAELSTHLGPEAAALAGGSGLSPATTRSFGYETAGAQLSELTLESLATSADAVAAWAVSSSKISTQVFGCDARALVGAEAERCFADFLTTRGARLLRRPLSHQEVL